MSKSLIYKGIKYKSEQELCEKTGVKISTLSKRLKKGWSIEEAVEGKRKEPIYINEDGIRFFTYEEFCKFYEVALVTCHKKRRNGYTMKEIAEKKIKRAVDHLGNFYNTEKEMCEKYQISVTTYRARTKKYGWSIEKALNTPSIRAKKKGE